MSSNQYISKSTSTSFGPKFTVEINDDCSVDFDGDAVCLSNKGGIKVVVRTTPGDLLTPMRSWRHCIAVTQFEAIGADHTLVCLALYAAIRRGRVERRAMLVVPKDLLSQEIADLCELKPLKNGTHRGARLDVALNKLAVVFQESLSVSPTFYVREVAQTVNAHVGRAFEEGFFGAVGRGEVAREQYVYVLCQQHAYVKYTTRILGYCVAYADSSELRAHFIRHLSEEINHEKIIEADLLNMGEDIEFVINGFEPNISTQHFLLGELALVSHFHDPVLLTAAPVAAEGITAHLDRAFIDSLNGLLAKWGVETPHRSSRFLSSHIEFDSGDDGHFEGSMRLLEKYLINEREVRRYVSALHAQMESFLKIYETSMEEASLWMETAPTEPLA